MTKVNVNDMVRVKLTEKGKLWYNSYTVRESIVFKADRNTNILEIELWDLMSIFGDHFYVGATPVFENNDITIIK